MADLEPDETVVNNWIVIEDGRVTTDDDIRAAFASVYTTIFDVIYQTRNIRGGVVASNMEDGIDSLLHVISAEAKMRAQLKGHEDAIRLEADRVKVQTFGETVGTNRND